MNKRYLVSQHVDKDNSVWRVFDEHVMDDTGHKRVVAEFRYENAEQHAYDHAARLMASVESASLEVWDHLIGDYEAEEPDRLKALERRLVRLEVGAAKRLARLEVGAVNREERIEDLQQEIERLKTFTNNNWLRLRELERDTD